MKLPTYVGEVEALADVALPEALAAFDCRNNRLAEMALGEDGFEDAVAAAVARYGARRIGLFLGTSTSGILQAELAYRARDAATGTLASGRSIMRERTTPARSPPICASGLASTGPSFVVSCACASTAKVFGSAARMIEAGLCDAAIVGGADSLCLTTLYGFHALALNAPGPVPSVRYRHATASPSARPAVSRCWKNPRRTWPSDDIMLLGVGESNDAYHMSSPHPEGIGARLAMERALTRGGACTVATSTTSTCMGPRRGWAMRPRTSRCSRCSAATRRAVPPRATPATRWAPRASSRRSSSAGDPPRLAAGQRAYRNGRSVFPQPLSLREPSRHGSIPC